MEAYHPIEEWAEAELRPWEWPQGFGTAPELARSELRPE